MKSKLIIVRSHPGSGKTTFCSREFPNILHLENDFFHYRNGEYSFSQKRQDEAVRWCTDSAIFAMSRGMDLCISNTFTKRRYIEHYVKHAENFGYDVEVYRMMGDFENIHGLGKDVIENFRKSMEDYDGETYVYPVPGRFGEYRMTKLRIGDRVANTAETDELPGNITGIECLGCGSLRVDYLTESDLFHCSKNLFADEKSLTRV